MSQPVAVPDPPACRIYPGNDPSAVGTIIVIRKPSNDAMSMENMAIVFILIVVALRYNSLHVHIPKTDTFCTDGAFNLGLQPIKRIIVGDKAYKRIVLRPIFRDVDHDSRVLASADEV